MILKAFFILSFLAVVGFVSASVVLLGREKKVDRFMRKLTRLNKEVDPGFNEIKKYYINLDRSVERRNYIEEQVERLGIKNIERVPGVDGKKLDNSKKGNIDEFKVDIKWPGKLRKGETGCLLSHIRAIKKFSESEDEYAIIMEDDIILDMAKSWSFSFLNFLKEVRCRPEIDIINLASYGHETPKKDFIFLERKDTKYHRTLAYLITRKGSEKLLDSVNDNNVSMEVDPRSDHYLYKFLDSRLLQPDLFIPCSNFDSQIRTFDYFNQHKAMNYRCLKKGKYI